MKKPKTIKDVEWRAIWENEDGGKGYAINVPNLIQEVIKRIKLYEIEEQKFIELAEKGIEKETHFEASNDRRSKINELKDFFNIKEWDLK